MPTVPSSGSGTWTTSALAAEVSLFSTTAAGTYVFEADVAAMSASDGLRFRAKTKILAAGTVRTAYVDTRYNQQASDDLLSASVPLVVTEWYEVTGEQIAGSTGRAIPWKVLSL